ncbi:MAG TPA: type IV secretory system conjugative DNA transfer family protein, partial [Candidatus Limnocylindria bacterium]|nr:type IV secretory system conjugative DNA transfer family protein [Candidatus Limnocylindria bacterium]
LDYPVAFNILESVDPKYKHLVASGLMGVFTKIWANLWSARMEYILNNTILALLDSPGNTLLGITRMYVDKKYRKKIVDNVKDPMVRAFWVDEFANYNEKYRTEAIAPIQNKVGQFLSSGIIRNIVGQPKSTIDMREIMDQNKILIMDLSKGRVGEDNSALLGAMLVTKLQLAAMSRTDIPEHERKDYYLYVDEFQNFATDSFATILSEARKYRLNLIVGHQYIGQLVQERNTKVRDAIFGNVGTLVVFRVGAEDAEFLVKEFEPIFTEIDIVNLPKYQILLKLMINGVASDPFSAATLPPNPNYFTGNIDKTIKVSRERYSNPVAEVEEKISRWMGAEYHQEAAVVIGAASEEKETADETPEILIEKPQVVEIQQSAAETIVETPVEKPLQFAEPEPPIPKKPVIQQPVPQQVKKQPEFRHEERRQNPPRRHNDRSFDSGPSSHKPNFRADDRHRSGNHHQTHKPSHIPQKKENPIWNQVASIHQEKTNQAHEKTQNVINRIMEEPAEQKPVHQPPATVHKAQHQDSERKVLQPGQTQTF